jgi:hypothetical protein
MKTEDLVDLLASGAAPVDPHLAAKRYARALVLGWLGAAALMLMLFGLRPDLAVVARGAMFWYKLAFPASLGAAALWATSRLARPGVPVGRASLALAAPIAVVWIAALLRYAGASDAAARASMLWGLTWRVCPLNIALLSVPVFVGVFWALKGLAPTRLRAAGAAGGLLAGATATTAYCLHCPEMGVPFWAIWYLLGMLIPTAVGAALGPRLLRW